MSDDYRKVMTCVLCGQEFVITNRKNTRTKHCPECRSKIAGHKPGGCYMLKTQQKAKHISKLDQLAREARGHGISYGQYVARLRMQEGANV